MTGAAGFIASHLVDALLKGGYEVIGVDSLRTGMKSNLSSAMNDDRFQFLEEDICHPELPLRVRGEIDLFFHLAAISSVRMSVENPQEVNRVNVGGTVNALDVASRLGARRFVLASSAAVYGDPEVLPVDETAPLEPLSPYAASKAAAEMYCQAFSATHGLEYTILRYFNVYGPRQAFSEYSGVVSIFISNALHGQPLSIEGDGKQTRSFIHVKDVVRSTILAAEVDQAAGQIINISGTESISINDLASAVRGLAKEHSPQIAHVDPRQGDVRDSIGKMERAKALLGFAPEVPFSEGINDTVQWFRSLL